MEGTTPTATPSVCLAVLSGGRPELLSQTISSINDKITGSGGLDRFARRIILDDSRNYTKQLELARAFPEFRVFRTNYTEPSAREMRISRNFQLMYALVAPEYLLDREEQEGRDGGSVVSSFLGKKNRNNFPAMEVTSDGDDVAGCVGA